MSVEGKTGSIVAGFRVGELVARGAMGAVYLAEDREGEARGAEAALAGARPGRAVPAALPAGVAAGGGARPPEPRPDDRVGRGRRASCIWPWSTSTAPPAGRSARRPKLRVRRDLRSPRRARPQHHEPRRDARGSVSAAPVPVTARRGTRSATT